MGNLCGSRVAPSMRSYSETQVFKSHELEMLGRAADLVRALPDVPGLRCHEVARAIGEVLGLQVQDGKYGWCNHSWLWTRPWVAGSYPPSILDPYAVGSMPQVKLVDMGFPAHRDAYIPGDERDDIDREMVKALIRIIRV